MKIYTIYLEIDRWMRRGDKMAHCLQDTNTFGSLSITGTACWITLLYYRAWATSATRHWPSLFATEKWFGKHMVCQFESDKQHIGYSLSYFSTANKEKKKEKKTEPEELCLVCVCVAQKEGRFSLPFRFAPHCWQALGPHFPLCNAISFVRFFSRRRVRAKRHMNKIKWKTLVDCVRGCHIRFASCVGSLSFNRFLFKTLLATSERRENTYSALLCEKSLVSLVSIVAIFRIKSNFCQTNVVA